LTGVPALGSNNRVETFNGRTLTLSFDEQALDAVQHFQFAGNDGNPTAVTTCEHCLAFGGSDFTGTHSAPVSGPHS
jgi:hypothetical protein